MTAFLFDDATEPSTTSFERVALANAEGHSERWLQETLFRHPQLLPMFEMFGHGESFVPLCRELPLRFGTSTVYLDLLGVSATGRLVLVECKLWRNPEARREVIAQLFEYASLLSEWSYADLEARLKQSRGLSGVNPMFALAKARHPALQEAAFVDAVSASLRGGEFLLAIAGDGIRSDLQSLRRLVSGQSGLLSRLTLVELRLYRDPHGRTLLVPAVPFKTEVVQHRVLVSNEGVPLLLDRGGAPARMASGELNGEPVETDRTSNRLANRAFWDRFIANARFDHPDQMPPRHGGNNWVRLELPGPVAPLVAYREAGGNVGLMLKFIGAEGREVLQRLIDDQAALESEIGNALRFEVSHTAEPDGNTVGRLLVEPSDGRPVKIGEAAQLAWFLTTANALVNALRPRLAQAGNG
ncbi:hypothetical protein [Cupriavidus lacunae]|uniref:DUF4268 domain-containing protein n=1 Tax=Cupriavidus lacunae TaxID=2666307 RepID=A0A370NU56_9BURK|nr:hypothetical protein [Cupriavidus lacunae]RDK09139.1 hypothetical protein DN412_17000 [Cupriavidus lacunae]